MYYIQETDKPKIFFKIFNIIQLEGNKIILPIEGKKGKDKKLEILAKKTKKIFDQTKSKKVVVSQKIKEQEIYFNLLHTYDLEIIEGRWLFELLSYKVLDYITQKKQIVKEETAIAILVNDLSENMLMNLRKIAKEYKAVSIITNHRERFKKIEKQILEEDGIMITIGNNKKRGLAKTELILNVDFPNELINCYSINERAIIVNIRGNIKIDKKRFNGIVINDYEIIVEKEEEFDYDKKTKYKTTEIYEAQINKRQPFYEIMKQIEKDQVKIEKLVGINSEI